MTPSWTPGRARKTPQQEADEARLVVLANLESAVALRFAVKAATPEQDAAFEKYDTVKVRALAPSPTLEAKNEADTALRLAVIALVKLVF